MSGVASDTDPWPFLAGYTVDRLLAAFDTRDALPEILEHITAAAGGGCAVVLRPQTGTAVAWNAGHQPRPDADGELLAHVMYLAGGERARPGIAEARTGLGQGRRWLLAATAGQPANTLAVAGRVGRWFPEARIALASCAAIISGRLRLDGAKARRETLADALVAVDPRPVVATDETGRIREFNHAAEELYQMPRADVLGADALTLLVPERYRPGFREAMAAYLSTGDTSVFGTRARMRGNRPDGTRPVIEFSVLPVQAGERHYFAAFVHDNAAVAAGQSRETDVRFGMLSELAPVGIVQADADGICTFVNGRWCRLTGQTLDQAVGRPWLDSVHQEDAGQLAARLAAAAADRQEIRADLRLCSTGGGPDTWVHAAARPVLAADGEYTGQLVAFTNVDERKKAESEREAMGRRLAEQNEKLRELDAAKTQFLGTVSHELRSPLTSIVSFTELLKADAAVMPDGDADYLEIIQRNAQRLLRLVGDLLYLNRLDEGAVSLQRETVDVPGLAAEAVGDSAASAAEAGVELRLTASDGPELEADGSRLRQVLDNLISNAVKFSGGCGTVEVCAEPAGGEWQLSVRDEGIGIPAAELSQLFGRFFRASNAVSKQVPGTGLGLATAKAIVELHGGSIEASSRPGAGTTITVHLPARR
jgi:PAS domain S-box-containing protein